MSSSSVSVSASRALSVGGSPSGRGGVELRATEGFDAGCAGPLTPAQVAHFKREGYVVVPSVLDAGELAAARQGFTDTLRRRGCAVEVGLRLTDFAWLIGRCPSDTCDGPLGNSIALTFPLVVQATVSLITHPGTSP